ncbi:MAG: DMT family transporter [Pseudonocardiaceae bacterium]
MDHTRSAVLPTAGIARTTTTRADLLRVAAAGALWGTGGIAGTLLDRTAGISPLAVAYRLLAGGLLLVVLLALAGQLRDVRRDRTAARRLATIGALAALYQSCYFAAVALTSVSLATLVTLGTAPVLVVATDAVLTRRRPGRALLAAIAFAVTGLTLLVGSPSTDHDPAGLVTGSLLALTSASGFAAITLLGRRPVPGLDPAATTGFGFSAGGMLLVLAAAPLGLSFTPDAVALGLVAYLGLVPTALAYVLYFRGLRTVHPGSAALIALLEPLTAAVLGALLLGDRLGPAGVLGGLVIGAAVLLCRRG